MGLGFRVQGLGFRCVAVCVGLEAQEVGKRIEGARPKRMFTCFEGSWLRDVSTHTHTREHTHAHTHAHVHTVKSPAMTKRRRLKSL